MSTMDSDTSGGRSAALEVLDRFYAEEKAYLAAGGPGKASFAGLAATLHPEVVMHQSPQLPYAGKWVGHDGLEGFFAAMSRAWKRLEVLDQQYLSQGDTVVVLCRVVATPHATATELDFPMAQVITVQDGRIRDFRPFYWDTLAVAEATGGTAG